MTVKEFKEYLSQFPDNWTVTINYPIMDNLTRVYRDKIDQEFMQFNREMMFRNVEANRDI